MRLNRFLSQCGIASRRGSEQVIREGRVSINGHIIRELATQVSDDDRVVVDGKPVRASKGVVIVLHKPKGYICSRGDTHERSTIYDLLPAKYHQLHHVGRLDKESEGLLLLTNRGDLSQRLLHPSEGVEKEYEVVVDKDIDEKVVPRLTKGMLTAEGYAKAERAWTTTTKRIHIVLKQGLKRQIRLMLYQLGYEVERLTRIRIGWLLSKGMPKGSYRELSEAEIDRFFTGEARKPAPPRPRVKRPPSSARSETSRRGPARDTKPKRSGAEDGWS